MSCARLLTVVTHSRVHQRGESPGGHHPCSHRDEGQGRSAPRREYATCTRRCAVPNTSLGRRQQDLQSYGVPSASPLLVHGYTNVSVQSTAKVCCTYLHAAVCTLLACTGGQNDCCRIDTQDNAVVGHGTQRSLTFHSRQTTQVTCLAAASWRGDERTARSDGTQSHPVVAIE